MCGIAGFVRHDARESGNTDCLTRMLSTLSHRGPDGTGVRIDGPVGLGHRRLAIIDVAGGAQPMPNEDGSVWITYNGEIYNHADLRSELEAKGHRYATHSDTETILHLYEEIGERCVERLQGMFAFALWDRNRKKLVLARDRLGIKPLYYAIRDRELLFASEIKALIAGGVRPEFNDAILPEYLANRFVSGEDTFFKSVKRLRGGHVLTWSRTDGLQSRCYWTLPEAGAHVSSSPSQEAMEIRTRLRDAVRSHLMSDVPLGLFLSGGLDSTGLLALMAPLAEAPVRTFAVGFADREADELAYARLAARAAGAAHREIVVSPAEFFRQLPRLIWHEDEPLAFPSSVPLYFVSRLAQEDVKVVLTGEGADELFLGYNRYRVAAWNERLGAPYWGLVPAAARRRIARLARALPSELSRYEARSFVTLDPGPRSQFCENFAVFPGTLLTRVLARPALLAARDRFGEVLHQYDHAGGDSLNRMSRADLHTYLERLLMKQDRMSMAASIESHVPYLD
ncbi:MAG: asparagine synthase (glutamine-hydrolyzing), partial [Acidobacteria bacterium]|nr:asparagine synthase (glutamine-hydrolyzing) [Acidobacteriota bacterium]